MNVKSLCRMDVSTVRASDELSAAAQQMRDAHVGYLVVAEPLPLGGWSKPIGVLTDRDIVIEVLAKGVDARSVTVGDIMTREPVVVGEDQSLSFALKAMRKIGARRIPVVGAAGHLVGILTMDDVVSSLAKELYEVSSAVRHEIDVEKALRP